MKLVFRLVKQAFHQTFIKKNYATKQFYVLSCELSVHFAPDT